MYEGIHPQFSMFEAATPPTPPTPALPGAATPPARSAVPLTDNTAWTLASPLERLLAGDVLPLLRMACNIAGDKGSATAKKTVGYRLKSWRV